MTTDSGPRERPGKASRFLISETVNLPASEDEGLCCASGEALVEAIDHALAGRAHVVMVRVSDAIRDQLDMLSEAGICNSRSSAATFMIREGVEANAKLFESVEGTTKKIAQLKRDLKAKIGELPDADQGLTKPRKP